MAWTHFLVFLCFTCIAQSKSHRRGQFLDVTAKAELINSNSLTRSDDDDEEHAFGTNCMKKVMIVDTVEYDNEEVCTHVTVPVCAEVEKMEMVPTQVEDCDTKYVKNCHIHYENNVISVPVETCNEEVKRDCDKEGEEICTTEYVPVCQTIYKKFELEEDSPDCKETEEEVCIDGNGQEKICKKLLKKTCTPATTVKMASVPRKECSTVATKVCGPEKCPIVKGEPKCIIEDKFQVDKKPITDCDITPQRVCGQRTQLVPKLIKDTECTDTLQEVCKMEKVNPRKVKTPIIKWWCDSDKETTSEDPTGGIF